MRWSGNQRWWRAPGVLLQAAMPPSMTGPASEAAAGTVSEVTFLWVRGLVPTL